MDSIQNKGLLWDKCAQKGLFVNITANSSDKVKGLFESAIEKFSNRKEPINVLNEEFIEYFKDELTKMNSFEARQKEYDEMLVNKPAPIDFTEPIVEQVPVLQESKEQIDWGQVIKNQNDILIKILETQIKIMFLIQKNNK
jgi:hypothetical protein